MPRATSDGDDWARLFFLYLLFSETEHVKPQGNRARRNGAKNPAPAGEDPPERLRLSEALVGEPAAALEEDRIEAAEGSAAEVPPPAPAPDEPSEGTSGWETA